MPDLSFQITNVESSSRSMTPLLQFRIKITSSPPEEIIQAVLLNAQIQIQCPRRGYNAREKENLYELFGPPESWGQTLRNRLWANTSTTVNSFRGNVEAALPVACTFDFNVASARYLNGLEEGEIPLLFLFSGSVFYSGAGGRLQVTPISWNSECSWRMPIAVWRALMEQHYPNSAWFSLRRDVFDRLNAYKRQHRLLSWEEAVERLLENSAAASAERTEVLA